MSERAPACLTASLALIASAVIAYEVVLTRLFSFLLHYHYSFLVVSGAVFGLGLGALVACRLAPPHPGARLAGLALAAAAAICLAHVVIASAPRAGLAALLLVSALPLIAAGAYLSLAFRTWGQDSQRLYFWDLAGAALGTVWVVPAMELGIGALSLCATVAAAAGALAAVVSPGRPPLLAGALACAAASVLAAQLVDIDLDELAAAADKPMFRGLSAPRDPGRLVETSWSAYARTDLVDRTGATGFNLYTDGGAGSYLFRFDGDLRRLLFLRREAALFPYYFEPRRRALVLGPGGGADVLYALMTGWRQVEAVEVNPDAVRMVRSRPDYSGHVYDLANVDIHVGDGRAHVRRSRGASDLISLPLVYAEAADLVGYQLSENYLFTREAFADYLDHLTPEGRLALLVHDHALMVRAVATLASLWEERGQQSAALLDHLVVINGTRAPPGSDRAHRPLLLVSKSRFEPGRLDTIAAAAAELGLELFFAPRIRERPPLASLRSGRLVAPGIDLDPVTDDRPYFYDVDPGVDPKLLVALALAATVSLVLVLLAVWTTDGPRVDRPDPRRLAPLAAALGAGYMMIEIFLLQRLVLPLGHPVLSLLVVLFGLLLATGVGSLLGRSLPLTSPRALSRALLGCAAGACLVLLAPGVVERAWALSSSARAAVALLVVLPFGLILGLPFPAALRLAKGSGERMIPWMWGVNGAASVFGSLAAVVLAMSLGSSSIPIVASLCYLLAGLGLRLGGDDPPLATPRKVGTRTPIWLFLVLLAVLWFGALRFALSRYTGGLETDLRPSPPAVPPQVWPLALGRP